MQRRIVSILLGFLAAACGGSELDVGSDGSSGGTGGTQSDPPPGQPLPDWPALRDCAPGGEDSPFVGTWDGAQEDFYFMPILRVRVVITSASEGRVCGHVMVGEDGSAPPPATDPKAEYPPGADEEFFGWLDGRVPPIDGVKYTILFGGARDEVLRFQATWAEAYEGYCMLQTPHYGFRTERWQCLPEQTGSLSLTNSRQECAVTTSSGRLTTSITQCMGCVNGLCQCNATGCTANASPQQGFSLTLAESSDGPVLTGEGFDYPYGNLTLRLLRVE
jgi:hypothetical protein